MVQAPLFVNYALNPTRRTPAVGVEELGECPAQRVEPRRSIDLSVDSSGRPADERSCCLLDVLGGRDPICAARPQCVGDRLPVEITPNEDDPCAAFLLGFGPVGPLEQLVSRMYGLQRVQTRRARNVQHALGAIHLGQRDRAEVGSRRRWWERRDRRAIKELAGRRRDGRARPLGEGRPSRIHSCWEVGRIPK